MRESVDDEQDNLCFAFTDIASHIQCVSKLQTIDITSLDSGKRWPSFCHALVLWALSFLTHLHTNLKSVQNVQDSDGLLGFLFHEWKLAIRGRFDEIRQGTSLKEGKQADLTVAHLPTFGRSSQQDLPKMGEGFKAVPVQEKVAAKNRSSTSKKMLQPSGAGQHGGCTHTPACATA
eukprot:1143685-Pelagomonas_calceolata.AAC.1